MTEIKLQETRRKIEQWWLNGKLKVNEAYAEEARQCKSEGKLAATVKSGASLQTRLTETVVLICTTVKDHLQLCVYC